MCLKHVSAQNHSKSDTEAAQGGWTGSGPLWVREVPRPNLGPTGNAPFPLLPPSPAKKNGARIITRHNIDFDSGSYMH